MYYHRDRPLRPAKIPRGEWPERNRRDHKALVGKGASHGVLVYAGSEPVGWCQYGRREELPRMDGGRIYRSLSLPEAPGDLWRITCFFVDREFRRLGVPRAALRGALAAIRRRGGGTVEAYAATHRGAVAIWFGRVEMFEKEGFRKVAALGRSNVVLRRRIRRSAGT